MLTTCVMCLHFLTWITCCLFWRFLYLPMTDCFSGNVATIREEWQFGSPVLSSILTLRWSVKISNWLGIETLFRSRDVFCEAFLLFTHNLSTNPCCTEKHCQSQSYPCWNETHCLKFNPTCSKSVYILTSPLKVDRCMHMHIWYTPMNILYV